MSDLVADDNGDISYEQPAGSENSDGSDIKAETAKPILPTSTAPLPFVRRRGRSPARAGWGRGREGDGGGGGGRGGELTNAQH